MKWFNRLISLFGVTTLMIAVTCGVLAANRHSMVSIMGGKVKVKNIHTMKTGGQMHVSMDIVLDSLHVA